MKFNYLASYVKNDPGSLVYSGYTGHKRSMDPSASYQELAILNAAEFPMLSRHGKSFRCGALKSKMPVLICTRQQTGFLCALVDGK